jgi:hypothetical protein
MACKCTLLAACHSAAMHACSLLNSAAMHEHNKLRQLRTAGLHELECMEAVRLGSCASSSWEGYCCRRLFFLFFMVAFGVQHRLSVCCVSSLYPMQHAHMT